MLSLFPQLFAFQELAPLAIRLVLALIFIVHGFPKLFTARSRTAQFFGQIGLKPVMFWTLAVGSAEFFGGIALLLGIFIQAAAGLIALVMVGAIALVKRKQGFVNGWEFDLALLAMALSLLALGPGAYSLDLPF
ncbi:MAG: DoxX family protein [Patescibacteria group bacterium]